MIETSTNPFLVIKRGLNRMKNGKAPSRVFLGITDPKVAFEKATLYWNLINNLFESKKHPQSELCSILFVKNEQIQNVEKNSGLPDCLVRIKNQEGETRKGQLDFYILTEEGQFLDLDAHSPKINTRYYLSNLQKDIREMSQKLAYVILTSPKMKNFNVFSFNQFDMLTIGESRSNLPFCEDIEDDIDKKEKRERELDNEKWAQILKRTKRGETVHICPGCDNEWNNSYCSYCGHPH